MKTDRKRKPGQCATPIVPAALQKRKRKNSPEREEGRAHSTPAACSKRRLLDLPSPGLSPLLALDFELTPKADYVKSKAENTDPLTPTAEHHDKPAPLPKRHGKRQKLTKPARFCYEGRWREGKQVGFHSSPRVSSYLKEMNDHFKEIDDFVLEFA